MDLHKIDILLQYALLVAGEGDEIFDRQLGPIHLIKYVYLADLAYAEIHNGETFTGVKWRFHKFGPWCPVVFERIQPALNAVEATKKTVSNPKYEDDFVRWSLTNDELAAELVASLPFHLAIAIKQAVSAFRADTASLLNHVYLTKPMLKAAPGEVLDLSPEKDKEIPPESPAKPELKLNEENKRRLQDLKNRIQARLKEKKEHPKLLAPDPPPRYDEVFAQGQACLDSLAGAPLEEQEGKVEFSQDVWKSPARYDPDLS